MTLETIVYHLSQVANEFGANGTPIDERISECLKRITQRLIPTCPNCGSTNTLDRTTQETATWGEAELFCQNCREVWRPRL